MPNSRALKTGIRPGPKRKVQLRTSTRALAVTVSDEASAPEPAKSWRRVTTGEQADDADHDHGGLDEPGGDEAERHRPVLPLHHRVHGDRGADRGEGVDRVQEAAPEHAGVLAGAGDVVRVVQDRPEQDQAPGSRRRR